MFQMHRIFCATPWELEADRSRFDQLIGKFNEAEAIEKGILFVPVSLVGIRDKRPAQYAVDNNIEQCRHYLLVLKDGWGPVERNFKDDYQLALDAVSNPQLPMRNVTVIAKIAAGASLGDGLPAADATYTTISEFETVVNGLLSGWLEQLLTEQHLRAATV
jgi:hypothetical protein